MRRSLIKIILASTLIFVGFLALYSFMEDDNAFFLFQPTPEEQRPINLGKPVYYVPDPQPPSNFIPNGTLGSIDNVDEKQVLEALNKLLGISYDENYIRELTKGKGAKNQIDWLYKWFPLTIALYCKYNILPATQLFQSGLESGWGTNSNSKCWQVDNNPTGMSILDPNSTHWGMPGMTVSRGTARPASEGGWYQHFNSGVDGFTASAYHQANDSLYKSMVDMDDTIEQLNVLKKSGWVAAGWTYDTILSEFRRMNGEAFNEVGRKIKSYIIANSSNGSNAVWEPDNLAGQPGNEWLEKYNVNIKDLNPKRMAFLSSAVKQEGLPYVWGGDGEVLTDSGYNKLISQWGTSHYPYPKSHYVGKRAFDCSSLVQWCAKEALGISLPRTTDTQESSSLLERVDYAEVKPGDLGFRKSGGHVVIFVSKGTGTNGKDTVFHASNKKDGVKFGTNWDDCNWYRIKGIDNWAPTTSANDSSSVVGIGGNNPASGKPIGSEVQIDGRKFKVIARGMIEPQALPLSPFSQTYGTFNGKIYHAGDDIACPEGTPIYAPVSGTVTFSQGIYRNGKLASYGNCVKIKSDDGKYLVILAHNSKLVAKAGDKVKQGQLVAYSGTTGNSSGPHCHFEVREISSGLPVDPQKLGGPKYNRYQLGWG